MIMVVVGACAEHHVSSFYGLYTFIMCNAVPSTFAGLPLGPYKSRGYKKCTIKGVVLCLCIPSYIPDKRLPSITKKMLCTRSQRMNSHTTCDATDRSVQAVVKNLHICTITRKVPPAMYRATPAQDEDIAHRKMTVTWVAKSSRIPSLLIPCSTHSCKYAGH